ncbi:MAG: methylated-DNA--[protein]-cysteine S-methyltransferase [Chitinophagales bacterium]
MSPVFNIGIDSPIGLIQITSNENAVLAIEFVSEPIPDSETIPEVLCVCKNELDQYFTGQLKSFSVKLFTEGTDFQKDVWNELIKIPYGETTTYINIAKQLNNEKAVRAVGAANGKNNIAIIIPCHRVIGENGKLTGYAGGLNRKQWLLEHERNFSNKKANLLF